MTPGSPEGPGRTDGLRTRPGGLGAAGAVVGSAVIPGARVAAAWPRGRRGLPQAPAPRWWCRRSCAAASSGHAAAPPSPAMNSRRRISHASEPLYGTLSWPGLHGIGVARGTVGTRWTPEVARGNESPTDEHFEKFKKLLVLMHKNDFAAGACIGVRCQ
jgi:hypothetical protein